MLIEIFHLGTSAWVAQEAGNEHASRFLPVVVFLDRQDREREGMNNMQDHLLVRERRFAGLTLLVSFLLFLGGSGLSIPLEDSKGTSIYFLSPQQELPVIAAHAAFWQWQSLLQLGGSLVATMGFVLLTPVLWTARNRVWPLLGIIAFLLSEVLWIVIEAFRLGTGVWAAQQATNTTTGTEFYDLLFRWLEGSLFAMVISLALGALVAYGVAFLTTKGVPRWVGWVILVYTCLGLGLVVCAGTTLVPPECIYLALLFLGVVLLRSRKLAAASSAS